MTLAEGLTRALVRAGIPITGVSLGDSANRATWVIHYGPSATAQQRTAGEALKLSYDFANDTTGQTEDVNAKFDEDKMLKALGIWCAQRFSVPLNTARSEILTIYRGL